MRAVLFALPMLALLPGVAAADIRATTEDGRTVLLKDNGTYEFLEDAASERLEDSVALERIRQEIAKDERSMTGAPCIGQETFALDNVAIVERTDSPGRVDILTEVTVTAKRRLPNGTNWDSCFEFAFGGVGANEGQTETGPLRFVFHRWGSQWRLE